MTEFTTLYNEKTAFFECPEIDLSNDEGFMFYLLAEGKL